MSDSLLPHKLHHIWLPCPVLYPQVCSTNHLVLCHHPRSQWCRPISLSSALLLLPSIFPSIRVLSNKSALPIRWPKYWRISTSSSTANSELVSSRIDCFSLLAIQGTLKSFLQHHSSKTSIFQHSAFFMVQLSHAYMTTGKTIALTIRTFVGKVMSLLFSTLSRFVIVFLPRSKHLFILWLQSPSILILEPKKMKYDSFHIFPIYLPESDRTVCYDLHFFETWVLSQLFTLLFHPHQSLFSSSWLSAIRLVSSAYLRLLVFLSAILILACSSSSPEFHMIYSAYKFHKQDDNIQPWHTPFSIFGLVCFSHIQF